MRVRRGEHAPPSHSRFLFSGGHARAASRALNPAHARGVDLPPTPSPARPGPRESRVSRVPENAKLALLFMSPGFAAGWGAQRWPARDARPDAGGARCGRRAGPAQGAGPPGCGGAVVVVVVGNSAVGRVVWADPKEGREKRKDSARARAPAPPVSKHTPFFPSLRRPHYQTPPPHTSPAPPTRLADTCPRRHLPDSHGRQRRGPSRGHVPSQLLANWGEPRSLSTRLPQPVRPRCVPGPPMAPPPRPAGRGMECAPPGVEIGRAWDGRARVRLGPLAASRGCRFKKMGAALSRVSAPPRRSPSRPQFPLPTPPNR